MIHYIIYAISGIFHCLLGTISTFPRGTFHYRFWLVFSLRSLWLLSSSKHINLLYSFISVLSL